MGARSLTGDAYLGDVFWDSESYLLPFYTADWPGGARSRRTVFRGPGSHHLAY
jgi:trehalose/maltose hydrolase-like predicted phosphorylase